MLTENESDFSSLLQKTVRYSIYTYIAQADPDSGAWN